MTNKKSLIPFSFTCIPKYFKQNGWLKDFKTLALLYWIFDRCNCHVVTFKHDGKEITLQPFEFIFGRQICSLDTGLTEDEIRTRIDSLLAHGILVKAPNKTPKRYTIFTIVTSRFSEYEPQVKPQVSPKCPPSKPHKQEQRIKEIKKTTQEASPIVVFSCLSELSIKGFTQKEKEKYTQLLTEKEAKNAIEAFKEKDRPTPLISIRAALRDRWIPSKVSADSDDFKKNNELAKFLECKKHEYTFNAGVTYLEISGGKYYECILYSIPHEEFMKQLESKSKTKLDLLLTLEGTL